MIKGFLDQKKQHDQRHGEMENLLLGNPKYSGRSESQCARQRRGERGDREEAEEANKSSSGW